VAEDRRPPQPCPGISRPDRLSDAGLERLRRQLESGARPSEQVLRQWVRRYGDAAQRLIDAWSVEPGSDVADPGDRD
jgi:hypothetical protein